MILNRIATLHGAEGDAKRAIDVHRQALALAQRTTNPTLVANIHAGIGRVYFELRNWAAAQAEFEEAGKISEKIGDKRGQAVALLELGKLNLAEGKELLHSAATLFTEIGDKMSAEEALGLMENPESKKVSQKRA